MQALCVEEMESFYFILLYNKVLSTVVYHWRERTVLKLAGAKLTERNNLASGFEGW